LFIIRSSFVDDSFKDKDKYLNKTNFRSTFFKNLAMTGVTEGCDFLGLFNIMLGRGGVKGRVHLPSLLYPCRGGGCRG